MTTPAASRCSERPDLDLFVPALVVAEVTYLVGRRLGAGIEDLIVTLDRRHFAAIRSTKGGSFRLLPE